MLFSKNMESQLEVGEYFNRVLQSLVQNDRKFKARKNVKNYGPTTERTRHLFASKAATVPGLSGRDNSPAAHTRTFDLETHLHTSMMCGCFK